MRIIIRNTWIVTSLLFFFTGCFSSGEQGTVGEKITIRADVPEEGNDLEFSWKFTGLPEASQLSQVDLTVSEDRTIASFTPDVEGNYAVEVSVLQYNDEISTQSFEFDVRPGEEESVAVEETSDEKTEPEETVAEETPSSSSTKWYEEQEAQEALKELTTPAVSETAEPVKTDKEIVAQTAVKTEKPAPKKMKPKQKKPLPGSSIPHDRSRYTIQVAAKRSLDVAKSVAADLIKAGYDAYIQKAYFKETDEIWYRVRVGSYEKKETALAVAQSLSQINHEKAWVDFVRYED
jgi:cell division septation protein DedD